MTVEYAHRPAEERGDVRARALAEERGISLGEARKLLEIEERDR